MDMKWDVLICLFISCRWVEERSDLIKLRRGRYACTNNNIFIIYMALRATPLHVGDIYFKSDMLVTN